METASFDAYAHNYDAAIQTGLRITGEDKDFFARARLDKTSSTIARLFPGSARTKAVDFGCGIGDGAAMLQEKLGFEALLGVDVSAESLIVAETRHRQAGIEFALISDRPPTPDADLVHCNGVFHHIPPEQRSGSLQYIHRSLKPGGAFVLWENNPFNPGVHLVMRAIPFDRDAQLLSPLAALRLLRNNGFQVLELRFHFIFPRVLSAFRRFEDYLARLPVGAQYQVIATKEKL